MAAVFTAQAKGIIASDFLHADYDPPDGLPTS
jgi:hypothetical protein